MLRSLVLPLLLIFPAALMAQAPQRIVSMNVCTDQLLLQLVDRSRIASLSYLATNPAYSAFADQVQGIALNRGLAEEIILLKPDLVLTGPFSGTQAANLLTRQGYSVTRLGFVSTIDEALAQIDQLGELTLSRESAASLHTLLETGMQQSMARLQPGLSGKAAVFLSNNGVVFGSNTLQDSFLHSLGLRNVAAEAGLVGPGLLSLENIVSAAPDYIFSHPASTLDQQLAHPLLSHPVWQHLVTHNRRIAMHDSWFDCAGPQLLNAYKTLEEVLL